MENIKIEIKNLREKGGYSSQIKFEPWEIRVDRMSPLGNPFRMENESQRDEVCDKYEKYFTLRIRNLKTQGNTYRNYCVDTRDEAFNKALANLVKTYLKYGKLDLYCWCAPKRCHAETIRKWLIEYLQEREFHQKLEKDLASIIAEYEQKIKDLERARAEYEQRRKEEIAFQNLKNGLSVFDIELVKEEE